MTEQDDTPVRYRIPTVDDAVAIWKMVDEAAFLDDNAAYTYLMPCRNFAATSVVAEVGDEVAGMVTAYPLPHDTTYLFVWQVNVREKFQGRGMASGMLEEILKRRDCANVRYIETTVTPGNMASRKLFGAVAAHFNTELNEESGFEEEHFPDDQGHEAERLLIIGPIERFENSIRVKQEEDGYRLYASYGRYEQPAYEPVNPVFQDFAEAMKNADEVREKHGAKEVVFVHGDNPDPRTGR